MSGSQAVFQQFLSVAVGSAATVVHDGFPGSIDMSVDVTHSGEEDGTTFEVAMYNLSHNTWSSIREGDPCRIVLGWERGPEEPVCFGQIAKKDVEVDGNDTRYIIKGKDESEMQTKARLSYTWSDKDPGDIVRGIAAQLSLVPGRIDTVGGVLEGHWAIKKDEPVSYWLDQLASEAEAITDVQWDWYCEAGRLYFESKEQDTVQAVVLSTDNTLMHIGHAAGDSESTDESEDVEFKSLCEPQVKRGDLVAVNHEGFSGVYKVTEYQFDSDTTTGDHYLSGTITPAGSQYEWSGYRAGGRRAKGSTGSGRVV